MEAPIVILKTSVYQNDTDGESTIFVHAMRLWIHVSKFIAVHCKSGKACQCWHKKQRSICL